LQENQEAGFQLFKEELGGSPKSGAGWTTGLHQRRIQKVDQPKDVYLLS